MMWNPTKAPRTILHILILSLELCQFGFNHVCPVKVHPIMDYKGKMSSNSKDDAELSKIAEQLNLSSGNDECVNTVFPLLQLPERAQRTLLEYLSPWCLMDLRLACKVTKKMVDDNSLSKLTLQVWSHKQMEEEAFRNSATCWKNVVIRSDAQNNDVNWIQNPLYSALLDRVSGSLTSLSLTEHRLPYFGLRSIMGTCQSLTRLEIGTLWCGDWRTEEKGPNSEEYVKLVTSLGKLERLSIEFLAWNNEEDLNAFKFTLSHCSSLKVLKVPHILMANFLQSDDEDEAVTEQRYMDLIQAALVDPVLKFISGKQMENKVDESISKRRPSAVLDVENMHHSELFPKVIEACFNSGLKLLNVSEAFENPIPDEELKYLKTIESLSGCTQYLNFHALSNLKSMKLDSETSADSDINQDSITAPLISLKSISYCLPGDISPNLLTFLNQCRPGVETLCMEFQIEEAELAELFPPRVLTQNFSHLQHLTLINWNGKDDDLILILQSLTSLLSLRLHGCPNITDRGFLGDNPSEPALLNLKEVKDIWIDCQITNAVLSCALRHLPLEALFYSSELVTLPGFLSLTQGPLATSLQSFPVIPPESCTDEILKRFLSYFKNLKRKPLSTSYLCRIDGDIA